MSQNASLNHLCRIFVRYDADSNLTDAIFNLEGYGITIREYTEGIGYEFYDFTFDLTNPNIAELYKRFSNDYINYIMSGKKNRCPCVIK